MTERLAPGVKRWLELLNEEQRDRDGMSVELTLDEMRAANSARIARLTGPSHPEVETSIIEVAEAGKRVRCVVHRPRERADNLPVVLFLHGGGVVYSRPDDYAAVLTYVAHEADCVVVGVDYGLAPENPFPGPLDDCLAVFDWVRAHAREIGGDNSRVITFGDSGGGYLAAALAEYCRLHQIPQPIHQILVYPQLDMTRSHDVKIASFDFDADLLRWITFNSAQLALVIDHHVGNVDRADSLVSPVLADNFAGLPPTTLIAAPYDLLAEEGRQYVDRLWDAGVPASYVLYEGTHHGFLAYGGVIEVANQAIQHIAAIVRYSSQRASRQAPRRAASVSPRTEQQAPWA